ncbi:MAG: hypothetical protein IT233_12105 [Bacteroidia bacterium]|nr:hypothetical protein [Bacteroidia bacterium]
MRLFIKACCLVLISSLLSQCKTPDYFPHRVNAPMLNNQGDLNIEASVGSGGLDFQGAVSPVKNLGLVFNYSTINGSHSHSVFEGGIGYYRSIGTKGLFELYGGYGMGDVRSTSTDLQGNSSTIKMDFSRIFIQPAIGLLVTKETNPERKIRGNSYFATRLSYLDFGSDQQVLFIEPVIGARMGLKSIQFNTQFGVSLPTVSGKIDNFPILVSFGLTYSFRKSNKE